MPFIVLEGLDGAGKSTQLEKLTRFLSERKVNYKQMHFPRYDQPIYGELIARFLRGEFGDINQVDPYLVALLYAGDRAQAAPLMKEWLDDEGLFLITDRFVYSNVAFQCAKVADKKEQQRLKEWIVDLEFNHNALPRPTISLFLDVPFKFTRRSLSKQREGEDRSYLEGSKDIHEESLDFQANVREMYLDCAKDDPNFHVIDCSDGKDNMDTPDNIFNKILSHIQPLI